MSASLKLTPAQRRLLTLTRDFGTPWATGERHPITGIAYSRPWCASTQAAIGRLVTAGLLQPVRHVITDAGRQAVSA